MEDISYIASRATNRVKSHEKMYTLYKAFGPGMTSPYGVDLDWAPYLPTKDAPGKWHHHPKDYPIALCAEGLHAALVPIDKNIPYVWRHYMARHCAHFPGGSLYAVSIKGKYIVGDTKICAESIRLDRRVKKNSAEWKRVFKE